MKQPVKSFKQPKMLRTVTALLIICALFLFSDAPAHAQTRIACVGDSITYGFHIPDRKTNSYPAVLARWMGTNYIVRNFGYSGATLLSKGDLPYIKQKTYPQAIAFKPDVVVIMLGTNDSKHHSDDSPSSDIAPDNWQYKSDFVTDYEVLIADFRRANPNAKFYLCYPTPCFPGQWGINDKTIHTEIIPLIAEVATDSHSNIIDLYTALSGHKDLFPDTIHPTATGAELMAAAVYHALTGKDAPANQP